MSKPEILVCIDVAQQHLDVILAGEDNNWHVSHEEQGLTMLCERLSAVTVEWCTAGLAEVVVDPRQIAVRATGQTLGAAHLATGSAGRQLVAIALKYRERRVRAAQQNTSSLPPDLPFQWALSYWQDITLV